MFICSMCPKMSHEVLKSVMMVDRIQPNGDGALYEHYLKHLKHHLQVRRLSHHPCIICWTGNNENEGALVDNW